MSKIKVAINGFGRIGRLLFRQLGGDRRFSVVAINDLSAVDNLAYLLKYDTVYGTYDKEISGKVLVLQESDPLRLPWGKLKVDVAVEATGVFDSFAKAALHLKAGAKKAVITAPAKDDDRDGARTVLLGINEAQFKKCKVTSNGSCTTNAAHPVVAIINEELGVEKAMLMTVHGYTASQGLVDSVTRGKDFRRGRAAAENIIPSSTGAVISVTRVLPKLAGNFDGMALRVPVVSGSIADLTFVTKRKTSVKEVNEIFKKAARSQRWQDVLAVTEEPVVSADIVGQPYGAIIDLSCTRVVGGNLVKVMSWYDNEWGYVATLVKHIAGAARNL